ncbi:hypothetical protein [Glycomyces albidus]|uniref:hypothetical protein n=1 Tax=Glycomyces albidus TaxID=2656774 RepID=UPI0018846008|nr:hypothetical protein [Glycomyces albidus]
MRTPSPSLLVNSGLALLPAAGTVIAVNGTLGRSTAGSGGAAQGAENPSIWPTWPKEIR